MPHGPGPASRRAVTAMIAPGPAVCPVCRKADATSWMLEKHGCQLYRCAECDHIFLSPVPDRESLDGIYSFESGYMVQGTQKFGEIARFPQKFTRVLERIMAEVPGGSLLDVGCSTGLFLFMAERAGFEGIGLEINRDTVAIARANGLNVIVGTLEGTALDPSTFDVVHLGDVLEHVHDPSDLLRRARILLKPDGIVVITTPNHDAFFPRATWSLHRYLGVPWSHPTPPHHLNQFSLRSLTRLLDQQGFTVLDRHFAPCSLGYEIRATGVPSSARKLAREGRWIGAMLKAAQSGIVVLAYSMVWLVDRVPSTGKTDFEMTLIARSAAHTGPRTSTGAGCQESV